VLNKLQVLAAPFQRVIWIDPDILVRRPVDELCKLPESVVFAGARNAGFASGTCWRPDGRRSDACERCRQWDPSERSQDLPSGVSPPWSDACLYEVNTGVLMLQPLRRDDFARLVSEPLLSGRLNSSDGSDQGVINTLLFGHGVLGSSIRNWPSLHSGDGASRRPNGSMSMSIRDADEVVRTAVWLPQAYNAIARVYALRPKEWQSWGAALVHYTSYTKPWLNLTEARCWSSARHSFWQCGPTLLNLPQPDSLAPLSREWRQVCGTQHVCHDQRLCDTSRRLRLGSK